MCHIHLHPVPYIRRLVEVQTSLEKYTYPAFTPALQRHILHPALPSAVDIWSGNHPFYQGASGSVVTDEGSVNRFKRRYEGLGSLSKVMTMADFKKVDVEEVPDQIVPVKKGGKKKK